jgi:drug/metabolite transporter (DMT)-like permease
MEERSLSLEYAVVLGAVLLLSVDALLIQLVSDLDDWTVVFWRYAFMGVSIFSYYFIQEQSEMWAKFYRIGWGGLLAGSVMAGAGICFTLAILNTHTANVFLIAATTSLWASIFSYFLFSELVPLRTLVAVVVAFAAVGVVVGIELSADLDSAWFGNVMAIVSSILTAMYLVIVRGMNTGLKASEKIDFTPALILASAIEVVVSAAAGASPNSVSDMDLLYLVLQGVVVLSIGLALLTLATKRISAPEVSLFMLIDSVLEPVWVYLAGFDDPPYYTIYCGIVVVVVLAANSILALYEETGIKETPKALGEEREGDVWREVGEREEGEATSLLVSKRE